MSAIKSFFGNQILVSAIIAWFLAQVLKIFTNNFKRREFSFSLFVASGGMPSSHSSSVCAMTTSTAIVCGLDSHEFAITFILSLIVMYDAAGVRRAAGEQAKALNKLIQHLLKGETEIANKDLKELIGHTPVEVFAGALLGILVALVVSLFFK
ncbi:MAG: divergent PAP2 family protein [Clostridiales bacterium]|nr:divergent PAP2 family protein [Clostridiales bacterium]